MYPLKFENLYFEKIWGGRDLEKFRDNLPEGNIGESWDIACHKNTISVVENGYLKGKNLRELIKKYGHDLVGSKISIERFPLLVKVINSREKLSVQVHPGDEYAMKNENDYGKTEAWYVIDAKPEAKIIIGTKNCSKEEFTKAVEENRCEGYLNFVNVKKGDAFLISSGMVHAICEGLVIEEIQQNSDITYRVYDYGRPREIHVEKSLDVIDFSLNAENLANGEMEACNGYKKYKICENQYFAIVKINIEKQYKDISEKERFHIITCVEGEGIITSGTITEKIKCTDSFFIPANLGEYTLKGNLTVLKSYVAV